MPTDARERMELLVKCVACNHRQVLDIAPPTGDATLPLFDDTAPPTKPRVRRFTCCACSEPLRFTWNPDGFNSDVVAKRPSAKHEWEPVGHEAAIDLASKLTGQDIRALDLKRAKELGLFE